MQRRMALRFETLTGDALHPWLPALSRLRIAVFRDWPYLYRGDREAEARYLRHYAASPGACVVLALEGDRAVGAATCAPMTGWPRDAFAAAGRDPARYCYFGESVLLPPYRGQGAGVRFFELREAHARALGLPRATFCAVRRAADDPRHPAGHVPLDGFWRNRGYAPAGISGTLAWREVAARGERPHWLDFWERVL
jgi:GNAT superfamily N-acetyltransferase